MCTICIMFKPLYEKVWVNKKNKKEHDLISSSFSDYLKGKFQIFRASCNTLKPLFFPKFARQIEKSTKTMTGISIFFS